MNERSRYYEETIYGKVKMIAILREHEAWVEGQRSMPPSRDIGRTILQLEEQIWWHECI